MTMNQGLREFVLAVHLTFSVGWIGAVVAYLVLGVSALVQDAHTVRASWIAITVLNVYKPRGMTPYGWRKTQQN